MSDIVRAMGRLSRAVFIVLIFIVWNAGVGLTPRTALAGCLVPPAFDPGVGELYFCPPKEGERFLINYTRRSFVQKGLEEDIWINFKGVFNDKVWINVGTREANDTSLPAWTVVSALIDQMRAIKAGIPSSLQAFLAPIETAPALTEEDRTLKQRLLQALQQSALSPAQAALHAVLYHVHLRPTREIEERSLMPINHFLSIPSHTDLLYAPRLSSLIPGAESKITVAAGIWTYDWDETRGARFVTEHYDGPTNVHFNLRFAHVYTRFAITEYHRQGLNDPAAVTPKRVARYIAALQSAGVVLRFDFAPDWEAVRKNLAQAGQSE